MLLIQLFLVGEYDPKMKIPPKIKTTNNREGPNSEPTTKWKKTQMVQKAKQVPKGQRKSPKTVQKDQSGQKSLERPNVVTK